MFFNVGMVVLLFYGRFEYFVVFDVELFVVIFFFYVVFDFLYGGVFFEVIFKCMFYVY